MKAPAFKWYAADYLADERVTLMTLQEEALMVREINAAAMRGDKEALKKYAFIGRLTLNDDTARPAIPTAIRRRVLAIGACAYCGSTLKLEVDHILPWSKGGTHDEANLQCLCKKCNRKKHAKLECEL